MKLKQWIPMIVASAALALTACANKHKMQDDSINDANTAYSENEDAQTSGLGDDSNQLEGGGKRLSSNNKTYYFDFDSNVVHDSDKPAIVAHANKLAANPSAKAMIEGHTDPRGSREYNVGLGERRAKAVAEIMTAKGVSRKQLRVVSYGAEKLASQGHSEADYQQDRRGVLVLTQ